MPELPEVETIKNNLINLLKGLKINSVQIKRSVTIVGDEKLFIDRVTNKTINDITRIGKFMIFHLSENVCFISHLRMEGKYYKLNENEPDSRYSRVIFHLNDGSKLCYDDSRCFGIMKLTSEDNYKKEKEIAKLGPEPFQIKGPEYLFEKAKNKSIPVKTFLLDQEVMTGLGNIYVDETLFASKIHPLNKPSSLTLKDWNNILNNSKRILNDAIKSGGSTIRSYHPGKGIDGNFQVKLLAYGKVGQPCPVCGHPFRKIRVNGRGTTFCPICQKYHGDELKIAICGPIGCGKSSVLEVFKDNGYDTISADNIVHELYKDPIISKNIADMFNLDFKNNIVDIDILRNYLFKNTQDKRKLERYIHPLVKKEVEKFLKNSITKIKVAEVPLLYDAKMETLFDYVIYVTSEKSEQLLKDREKENASSLKVINSINKFEQYKKEADIVLGNNDTLASLKNKVNDLINKDLLNFLN